MTDLEYYQVKMLADGLGYLAGILAGFLSYHFFFKKQQISIKFSNREEKFLYHLSMLAGAMLTGILVSTFDWYQVHEFEAGKIVLSKTVAGAIAGGVIASEVFKKIFSLKFNRGILLVPSLCVGILVGRIGAFLIGLRDNTHGIETSLIWGYDYGDGVFRHPTQIYEILVLFAIFCIFIWGMRYQKKWFVENGFFVFSLVYFSYRFLVGFLMPYSDFWFGLNSIQVVSIGMILYSIYKLKKYGKIL